MPNLPTPHAPKTKQESQARTHTKTCVNNYAIFENHPLTLQIG